MWDLFYLHSILLIAGTSGAISEGAYLLRFYSLGLAIPFFLSAIFFHKIFRILQKFTAVTRFATKVLGGIHIAIGLLLLTNYFGAVTTFINNLFY